MPDFSERQLQLGDAGGWKTKQKTLTSIKGFTALEYTVENPKGKEIRSEGVPLQ